MDARLNVREDGVRGGFCKLRRGSSVDSTRLDCLLGRRLEWLLGGPPLYRVTDLRTVSEPCSTKRDICATGTEGDTRPLTPAERPIPLVETLTRSGPNLTDLENDSPIDSPDGKATT